MGSKLKMTLFFIEDSAPTQDQREEAERILGNVGFRNVQYIQDGEPVEACDAVYGAIPKQYRDLPRAKLVSQSAVDDAKDDDAGGGTVGRTTYPRAGEAPKPLPASPHEDKLIKPPGPLYVDPAAGPAKPSQQVIQQPAFVTAGGARVPSPLLNTNPMPSREAIDNDVVAAALNPTPGAAPAPLGNAPTPTNGAPLPASQPGQHTTPPSVANEPTQTQGKTAPPPPPPQGKAKGK